MAAVIEAELRHVGFDKPAFDTIVAAGPNSAVPHYRAGDRRLSEGDLVVMDFGGMLDGYAVDLTRTMTVGRPRERERRLLEDVAAAQAAAFVAIGIGKAATAVDAVARQVLEAAGLGEAFSHGTGHGLGLGDSRAAARLPLAGGPEGRSAAGGNGVHPRAGRVFSRMGWRAD